MNYYSWEWDCLMGMRWHQVSMSLKLLFSLRFFLSFYNLKNKLWTEDLDNLGNVFMLTEHMLIVFTLNNINFMMDSKHIWIFHVFFKNSISFILIKYPQLHLFCIVWITIVLYYMNFISHFVVKKFLVQNCLLYCINIFEI